ncbi:hypothetical protein Avbf_14205 [Armadillidium vulgare]|nr:hypothetical protein Avbf_14205 [Armadillidium vulgare]
MIYTKTPTKILVFPLDHN